MAGVVPVCRQDKAVARQSSGTLSDARNSRLTRSLISSTPATPERLVTLHVPKVCTPPFST